jgi:hypothetical protein
MKRILSVSLLVTALVACESSVEITSSSSTSSGSGGAGGEGGAAQGTGGSAGGTACTRTNGHLEIVVTPFDGNPPTCTIMGEPTLWTAIGEVKKSDSATGELVIDQCSPDGNCTPMLTTLAVSGDALELDIPIGAFVEISYTVTPVFFFCIHRILIQNVPTWGGLTNPISTSDRFYLIGAEGETGVFESVPFSVGQTRLACSTEEISCGGLEPGDYTLVVGDKQIGMGKTETFAAGARNFSLHNLRSYQTEWCDDYWNWAFWATEQ